MGNVDLKYRSCFNGCENLKRFVFKKWIQEINSNSKPRWSGSGQSNSNQKAAGSHNSVKSGNKNVKQSKGCWWHFFYKC